MGITIEKAIENLNDIIDEGWLISDMEKCTAIDACELAIETIHKYQKIQEIVKGWNDMNSFDSMVQISEVVEDGND